MPVVSLVVGVARAAVAAVERLRTDRALRDAVVAAGRGWLAAFDLSDSEDRFAAAIRELCGKP